jgi:hypothetical protein
MPAGQEVKSIVVRTALPHVAPAGEISSWGRVFTATAAFGRTLKTRPLLAASADVKDMPVKRLPRSASDSAERVNRFGCSEKRSGALIPNTFSPLV